MNIFLLIYINLLNHIFIIFISNFIIFERDMFLETAWFKRSIKLYLAYYIMKRFIKIDLSFLKRLNI